MTEYVKTYKCPTCGALASGKGHLCHPVIQEEKTTCELCNKDVDSPRHVCSQMLERLEYTCKKCGRLAVYDSLLCEPDLIAQD